MLLLALKSLVDMWLFVVLMTSDGAVFGSQVGYMKALAGIVWSMLLLNESMSPLAWVSFAIILVGLFLIESRKVDEHQSTEDAVVGDKPEVAVGAERGVESRQSIWCDHSPQPRSRLIGPAESPDPSAPSVTC